MKRWLLLLWLLLPLPVVVWHYGPGQKWLARDHAHTLIQKAQAAEATKNWSQAESLFREVFLPVYPEACCVATITLKFFTANRYRAANPVKLDFHFN